MRWIPLVLLLSIGCGAGAPAGLDSPSTAPAPSGSAPTARPDAAGRPSPGPTGLASGRDAGLPLFDAHLHYSADAWTPYPPERVLELLERAGVRRALLSSTPDEGTLRLYERAPHMFVPFLRPYRVGSGPGVWARDGTTVAYVRSTYRPGVHRGIGEIHLSAGEAELPVVRAILQMAVSEGLWLQIHTDARGIVEVMRGPASGTRVVWAHAGQSASPAEIATLLARYPTMWVELSGRTDIAPGGSIDPSWRELLTRHEDRFLVGSDTWINPQWERLVEIQADLQVWLAQLPPDVARKIASGNADVLFPTAR